MTGLPTWISLAFHIATCCGAIPLDNTWSSDWVVRTHICMLEKLFTIPKEFYARQRIEPQVAMAEQKVWYVYTLLCFVIFIGQFQCYCDFMVMSLT